MFGVSLGMARGGRRAQGVHRLIPDCQVVEADSALAHRRRFRNLVVETCLARLMRDFDERGSPRRDIYTVST